MIQPFYSIVIPVYKSVDSLEPLYDGIASTMKELNVKFEVLFIDDNGSNESWNKLLQIKNHNPTCVTLIKLNKNFGQNGATLCGINEAKGDIILTIDDDLQVHPSELKKLIEKHIQDKCDVIYGVYEEKSSSAIRNLGSNLIKKIFNKSENGSNVGSSIRLLTSNIAKHLQNHSQDHLFINQIISWYTFDVQFVEILRNPRYEGKSGYSIWQLFLIAFRLLFLYTSIPLKIMIVLCVISSIVSLALASFYIYQHFVLGNGLGFLSLIVVAISLILASLSVMGIYLNRIYESRVRKPHYAIKLKL
jgi:glycosyltransferase involved in cell wall biosynthesis